MQNEKRLRTGTLGLENYLYSISQACNVIDDYISLAKSSRYITDYVADGMESCVKQMANDVAGIKRELEETNKDKEQK